MNTNPLVVLFADKNPGPGRLLRGELRGRGAHVFLAGSTEEAIHQAALAPPDIVVMDDDLPGEGRTDLGAFIHDAFPKTGIVLLHGDGPPTSSPSGLELLLWAHKRVDDQTLIETIEFAFPGRLAGPTPYWPRATQILCVDQESSHPKSPAWFITRPGENTSRFRIRAGRGGISHGILHTRVPESGGASIGTGLAVPDAQDYFEGQATLNIGRRVVSRKTL